jgi:hypothetical protein
VKNKKSSANPPGRPRKYATEEERKAAQREKKEALRRQVLARKEARLDKIAKEIQLKQQANSIVDENEKRPFPLAPPSAFKFPNFQKLEDELRNLKDSIALINDHIHVIARHIDRMENAQ